MNKLIITESERESIKNQYLNNSKDYVFDFVITENNKYLILFDNVFIKDDGGKCIGSIWENTQIFDELLQESLSKLNNINESIINEINEITKKIVWKKDDIKKWVSDSFILNEQEEKKGFLDKLYSGAREIGGKIMSSISNVAMSVFKQGILPLFRWIRRFAMTNIGIVVDAVVAFFSLKGSAIIWFIIVAIDIYEIATGDYDPKEPQRMKMPFFYLITDLISAVLTSAAGVLFKKAAPVIAKEGIKNYPNLIDILKKLLYKIPNVEKTVKSVLEVIKRKMPSGSGVISTIVGAIGSVLQKAVNFIKRLLSVEGLTATAGGVVALGATKAVEKGIELSGKGEALGKQVAKANKYLQQSAEKITGVKGIGGLTVDDKSKEAILSYLNYT